MIQSCRRLIVASAQPVAMVLCLGSCAGSVASGHVRNSGASEADREIGWSQSVAVGDELQPVAHYRARMESDYLVIEVKHRAGWHSYAMDNEVRATKKLAGAEPLGIELPTSIQVEGAKVIGRWYQTPPDDLSDKEIEWFTWGFPGTACFVTRLEFVRSSPISIFVLGQICNDETCRDVDVELRLDPAANRVSTPPDFSKLILTQEP